MTGSIFREANLKIILRSDPLQVFRSSITPVGLYARKNWLGESQTIKWRHDFNHTIGSIYESQSNNGSWNSSLIDTIRHIFYLHLTVRENNAVVDTALDWLLNQTLESTNRVKGHNQEKYKISELRGLPFIHSSFDVFLRTASIFLATVFGMDNDKRILAACDVLEREGINTEGRWSGWASLTNALRAFAVHPKYARSGSVVLAVNNLANAQTFEGNWMSTVPFYKTINTLAHLNMPQADTQLERALARLPKTQSSDGSWGRVEREWSTFLVVHALKRKGIL